MLRRAKSRSLDNTYGEGDDGEEENNTSAAENSTEDEDLNKGAVSKKVLLGHQIYLGFCNCFERRAIKSRIWLGSPGPDTLSLALLLFPVQAHRGQDWQEQQIRF